jgi:uncharacterized repeat protein (TIGR03803 family)
MRLTLWISIGLSALAVSTACQASSFTILHVFNWKDGAYPNAGVVEDGAGNLYGTTESGGNTSGFGTVFRLAPNGKMRTLHRFSRREGFDPRAAVALGPSGTLFGTTFFGKRAYTGGTIFEITTSGEETLVNTFQHPTGYRPMSNVLVDSAGNLFGTTSGGGQHRQGVVYEIPAGGSQQVLYAFAGGTDGAYTQAGVIEDQDGNLYGTTYYGGDANCGTSEGCGTVFKLAPDGTETVLHAFHSGLDGRTPLAGVIRDAAGNIYGTTIEGGGTGCMENVGCGTVFKIAPDGTETILHAFGDTDGRFPEAGLVEDASGNLYGAAYGGGNKICNDFGCGLIFEIAPDGTETTLHEFSGADGQNPLGTPILDGAGNLYGTAQNGGGGGTQQCPSFNGCGTIFKLTP